MKGTSGKENHVSDFGTFYWDPLAHSTSLLYPLALPLSMHIQISRGVPLLTRAIVFSVSLPESRLLQKWKF